MPNGYSAVQQQELKTRLMVSTIKVLKEKGYVHADVETIAKAAGTSKSYLYRLFESKEELIVKALSQQQYKNVDRLRYLIKYTKEDIEASLHIFLEEVVLKGTCNDYEIANESIFAQLPDEIIQKYFSNLSYQYEAMIKILGLENTDIDSEIFGNLFITLFIIIDTDRYKSYFYKDAMQLTYYELIDMIIRYVKKYLN